MSVPARPRHLVVVTGTGTEVGKTWVSAALVREARRRGVSVAARKPAQSFDPGDRFELTDAAVLASASGEDPAVVCPPSRRYPVAMAPPMAASVLGLPIPSLEALARSVSSSWPPDGCDLGLVEGAGGVASPLAADGDSADLARALAAHRVVLVADAGLGTINAVRLSVRALEPLPVVVHLNRFHPGDDLHRRNLDWLRSRDGLTVTTTVEALLVALLGAPLRAPLGAPPGERGVNVGPMATSRPVDPRIPPLPPEERSPAVQELLDTVKIAGSDANIFTTFVRAEGLTRKWLPFGGKLLSGKIPARDRELLILRTGWNCRAEYEWAQHALVGQLVGLSAEEVDRVIDGPDAGGWDDWDATLLRAADELHRDWCISDSTWVLLASRYDVPQLIEVPMLVGHYHMVAMTLNSLGVQIDEGLSGFPSGAGA